MVFQSFQTSSGLKSVSFLYGSCADETSIILLWFLCPSRDPVYGFIVGDPRASEALARGTSNYLPKQDTCRLFRVIGVIYLPFGAASSINAAGAQRGKVRQRVQVAAALVPL